MFIPPLVDQPDAPALLKRDPELFLGQCRDRHGPLFTVVIDESHRLTFVLDPHLFQSLLTAPEINFGPASRQSKSRFGLENIVKTDEGVRALSNDLVRSLNGAALHELTDRFRPAMYENVANYLSSIDEDGAEVNLQDLASRTIIPANVQALLTRSVYDSTFTDDFLAYHSAVALRFAGSNTNLSASGKAAEKALIERLRPVLKDEETQVVRQLKAGTFALTGATEEEQLRVLLMLTWASMVNLVPTSVWMYACVMQDPEIISALDAERCAGPLAQSVAKETLRLFSRPNIYREIAKDLTLKNHEGTDVFFRQGDWIALFPRFLHHDPEVFRNAESFQAARFCPDKAGSAPVFCKHDKPLAHSTLVFGLGQGHCPGMTYAFEMMKIALGAWISTFDARLVEPKLPEAKTDTAASTPESSRGIPVYLRIRKPVDAAH